MLSRTALSLLTAGVLLTACSKDDDNPENNAQYEQIKPKGPAPIWGPDIQPQMLAVIEKLDSFAVPPLNSLSAQEARQQPSAADAAMAVMRDYNIQPSATNVDTMGRDIAVQGGQIHLRVYTPRTGKQIYPVIVYYHGGGWVIANLDTYDASARSLAQNTDAVVVSVAYRQGPEFKFPTAHNDSYAAYAWAFNHADSIKGDSTRIAVAGESAGGNLAAAVSMMARDSGMAIPVHQVLVYPIANNNTNDSSYLAYGAAKPLNKPLMEWFFDNYLRSSEEGDDPRISLVDADLTGLPATTIIGAELDPLQTEGKLLADKLSAAGVQVDYQLYNGVTHEFFGMADVVPEAKEAQTHAVERLKAAF